MQARLRVRPRKLLAAELNHAGATSLVTLQRSRPLVNRPLRLAEENDSRTRPEARVKLYAAAVTGGEYLFPP